jgi:hypothetical protein
MKSAPLNRRHRSRARLFLFAMSLAVAGNSTPAGAACSEPDDAVLKAAVEEMRDAKPYSFVVRSGTYRVTNNKSPFYDLRQGVGGRSGEISFATYLYLKAFEGIGLIRITGDPRAPKRVQTAPFADWSEWEGSVGRKRLRIRVDITPLGNELAGQPNGSELNFPFDAGSSVAEVVTVDTLRGGLDRYKVVYTKMSAQVKYGAQIMLALRKLARGALIDQCYPQDGVFGGKYNLVALLKLDKFECKWKGIAADVNFALGVPLCTGYVESKARDLTPID